MAATGGTEPAFSTAAGATVTALLAAIAAGDDRTPALAGDVSLAVMTTGEVTRGREAVLDLLAHLYRHAFAVTPNVRTVVASAERAIVESEFTGRHVGEFAGIGPTGAPVRVPYAAAFDLTAGEITAIRLYLPLDLLVRQIRDRQPRPIRDEPPMAPPPHER